jgi:NADH dehydrogenase [ubiquinone] 1 alpha subcomplex assembly factor 1
VTVTTQLDLKLQRWHTINDSVMGGISQGEIIAIDNRLRFRGRLSLQNKGGFASARRSYSGSPMNAGSLRLCVKGDTRRYQFRVRLDDRYDSPAWRASFDTNASWRTVTLPFEAFKSVYRGRTFINAGQLAPEKIRQIGFLLADKNEGLFQLDFTDN